MIGYLFSLIPAIIPIAIVVALLIIMTVLYLLARCFFDSETASGIATGAIIGIFIGIIIGLICQYLSVGSIAEMLLGYNISWMPFVYGWAATVMLSGIIGGIISNR